MRPHPCPQGRRCPLPQSLPPRTRLVEGAEGQSRLPSPSGIRTEAAPAGTVRGLPPLCLWWEEEEGNKPPPDPPSPPPPPAVRRPGGSTARASPAAQPPPSLPPTHVRALLPPSAPPPPPCLIGPWQKPSRPTGPTTGGMTYFLSADSHRGF